MTNVSAIRLLSASPAGREILLTHIATTESAAVLVLDDILRDLQDSRLIKMAMRHRADEVHHAAMLNERLAELGINPDLSKANASLARLETLWATLQPSTVAEKYAVLQVIEEQDAPLFAVLADAMRPHDEKTAAVFERMGKDEQSHVRYCRLAAREFGDDNTAATLERYRSINESTRAPIGVLSEFQTYDRTQHFDMIQSWSETPLDPSALGNGLLIPGLACGFVDGIGTTRTAFFYGLKANPRMPMVARGKAILRLAQRILQAASDAGYTAGVTSTANDVVERFWVERLGFKRNGESVLMGAL